MGRMHHRRENDICIKGSAILLALILILFTAFIPSGFAFAEAEGQVEETQDQVEEALKQAEDTQNDEVKVDVSGKSEGYSAVLYDNSNGLPTSEANAIAETSEGFIWIGSYSGLIRYDGNSFERIDSTGGIASVVSLFVDSKDRLWVGTNDNGAFMIHQGETKHFNKQSGLKSLSVRAFCEDKDGSIYAATTRGIVIIDNKDHVKQIENIHIADEYIRDVKLSEEGIIYGVTNDNDLFTLENGKVKKFYDPEKLGISGVIAIEPDPSVKGGLWLGTENDGVFHGVLDNGFTDVQNIDVSPLTYAKGLELIDGYLWVCTDNGIGFVSDGKINVLGNIPVEHSIDHVMADYEGNLWFTSSRQGVMKIVRNRFRDIFESFGLKETVVNTTCYYNGQLYVGTDDGLILLDPKSGEQITNDLTAKLQGARIRSIIRDSKGNIWISTFSENGLLRYDGSNIKVFDEASGIPSSRVRAVTEMSDGTIMAACTGGVVMIEGDEITRKYSENDGLNNTEILTTAETNDGKLVFGSDGDGLYIIDGGDTIHLGTDEGLSSDVVMRVKNDRTRDIIWFVTSNSIGYLDKDNKATIIDNFPYSNNFDLYENNNGEMWILSSNGVYEISVDELMENKDLNPVFYDMNNGLPCISTANSYSELTDEGDLFIAGSTGVALVNIDKPFEDVAATKVSVPFVLADDQMIYPDKKGTITVPSDTRKLTVYDYVYSYSLSNPQVTYYLEGFDKKKVTVRRNELTPVDYTNLRGGTYTFVIELSDEMGHNSTEYRTVINVRKAFYEQTWFLIAVGIAFAGLMYIIVRYFMDRQARAFRKKEAENKQYVNEITTAFAKTIDMKDKYTRGHSMRVAKYTAMLARELGYDEDTVDKYYNIALLHDIGKIGVPEEVLNKPGKLTDREFSIIKSHSALGYNVLKDISIMPELAIGAGDHHERPDGKGYPHGLKGDEIPRVAQIIAVADTFDAMYSDRPYRKRMNFNKVLSILEEVKGTQLTPDVVDALLRLAEKGELKAPDDTGGGSTQDIDNIHKGYEEAEKKKL